MLIIDCYTTGVWKGGARLRREGGRKKGECSMKVTVGRDAMNGGEGEMKTQSGTRHNVKRTSEEMMRVKTGNSVLLYNTFWGSFQPPCCLNLMTS